MVIKTYDKSFRVTGLLYLGVILVPLLFSIVFWQLGKMESGSETIRNLGESGGEMLVLPYLQTPQEKSRAIASIEKKLKRSRPWFVRHNRSKFYVGGVTPLVGFEDLWHCWQGFKKDLTREHALICWKKARGLTFSVERAMALEMDRFKNILYLSVAGVMLLLVLLIFIVRESLYCELRKEALRDEETGLFNREYCREVLGRLLARASRSEKPLSGLYLEIVNYGPDASAKQRAQIYKTVAKMLDDMIRQSDIACGYDSSSMLVWLPDTPEEGAKIVVSRLMSRIEESDLEELEGVEVEIRRATSEEEETPNSFIKRLVRKQ